MPSDVTIHDEQEIIEIDLRNPFVAALLAWAWPGAGHLYQRRYAKGVLFMLCIVTTWVFGLALGEGHVAYASFKKPDRRWHFVAQMGVGLPAAPALMQRLRVYGNPPKAPLWGGWMAPPRDGFELSSWHHDLNYRFELGTLFTMVAGLLNILAIYDAYAGPLVIAPHDKRDGTDRKGGRDRTDSPPSPQS